MAHTIGISPIGYVSCDFVVKNGTPRQAGLMSTMMGSVTVTKHFFTNPEHSLEGLQEYSHLWLLFIFHKNDNKHVRAKIKPPRLNGKKVGVFASRSPHRPNPIGLSLVRLEKIEGATIYFSGVDMVHGTPVVDIKPYIPAYDSVISKIPSTASLDLVQDFNEPTENKDDVYVKTLVDKEDPKFFYSRIADQQMNDLDIQKNANYTTLLTQQGSQDKNPFLSEFNSQTLSYPTKEAESKPFKDSLFSNNGINLEDIYKQPVEAFDNMRAVTTKHFSISNCSPSENNIRIAEWLIQSPVPKLKVLWTPRASERLHAMLTKLSESHNFTDVTKQITEVLEHDPRSFYRRQKCDDRLYYFVVKDVHVTAWFDDTIAEILRVQKYSKCIPKDLEKP